MCRWVDQSGRPLNMGRPLWRAREADEAARDPLRLAEAIGEDILRAAREQFRGLSQPEAVARFLGTEAGLVAYAAYRAARRRAGLA